MFLPRVVSRLTLLSKVSGKLIRFCTNNRFFLKIIVEQVPILSFRFIAKPEPGVMQCCSTLSFYRFQNASLYK